MAREAALKLAQEKGIDLIEISPLAKPPVSRLMSFDKFRYQQEKKIKKQRAQQRGQDVKQVQIGLNTAKHDLEIKTSKVNKFLDEGNQVTIVLVLRGREKAHKDVAKEKLKEFLNVISPDHKVMMEPKFVGRGLTTQIVKK